MVTMPLLSPSDIQYLPGLECGEENVEISQAVSLQDRQVLQVMIIWVVVVFENGNIKLTHYLLQATFICNTWYCLNSSLLVVYKLLH